MTVKQLKVFLQGFDENAEVVIATQNMDMSYRVADVAEVDGKVYIAQGTWIEYLDEEVTSRIDW